MLLRECCWFVPLIYCILQNCCVNSTEIECDAISNTDFGRRFCFIRHLNGRILHNVTYKPNSIADEKREIIFDNCTLDALPLGMFVHYPYVKTLYVWNIELKKIEQEAFENSNELLTLDLSKNRIAALDAYTFSLATHITLMDLSQNRIATVHVDAFSGLQRLNILNLDSNHLKLIPANCFAALIQLKTIRLSRNLIKMIPVELFGHNHRLRNIHLNDNNIEWLFGEQTFRHLNHVNEFDVHNNPIVNFGNCVINAQSIDIRNTNAHGCYIGARTKRLMASNNQIAFIDTSDAIATNLEHLDVAHNRLTKLHNLTRFEHLKYLDLTGNAICDIGLNSFGRMHQLEVLNLRNSGLSHIYFGLFSHKSKLRTLDLSYNKLGHIDFRMFVAMKSLVELHLDGNNLNQLDATEVRTIFPALTKIGISQNDWSCHQLASIVKHLESNGIAINSIDSTKNTENIKGIPCSSGAINGHKGVDDDDDDDHRRHDNHNDDIVDDNNDDEMSTVETESASLQLNAITTAQSLQIEGNQEIRPFTLNNINEQRPSHEQWSNVSVMPLIVRLMELKYDVENTVQSANEVARKLESILQIS